MPSPVTTATLAATGHPLLATTLHHAAAAMRLAADPATSDQLLLSTVNDLHPLLAEYSDSAEADSDTGCVRGCDEDLEACLEHWASIAAGEQVQAPGGLDEGEELEQTPGGAIDLEDNPLDVENDDPGVGSGVDDHSTGDGVQPVISKTSLAMASALCSLELLVCMAACVVPG